MAALHKPRRLNRSGCDIFVFSSVFYVATTITQLTMRLLPLPGNERRFAALRSQNACTRPRWIRNCRGMSLSRSGTGQAGVKSAGKGGDAVSAIPMTSSLQQWKRKPNDLRRNRMPIGVATQGTLFRWTTDRGHGLPGNALGRPSRLSHNLIRKSRKLANTPEQNTHHALGAVDIHLSEADCE